MGRKRRDGCGMQRGSRCYSLLVENLAIGRVIRLGPSIMISKLLSDLSLPRTALVLFWRSESRLFPEKAWGSTCPKHIYSQLGKSEYCSHVCDARIRIPVG